MNDYKSTTTAFYGTWINIDEQLPPFNQPVLVHQPNWKGQPVTVAELEAVDKDGFRFQFDLARARVDRQNGRYSVTHWMPLPKAPYRAGSYEEYRQKD